MEQTELGSGRTQVRTWYESGMNVWPTVGIVAVGHGSSNRQTKLGQSPKKDGSSTRTQTYALPLSGTGHLVTTFLLSGTNLVCKQCDQATLDATDRHQLSYIRAFGLSPSPRTSSSAPWDCLAVFLSPQQRRALPSLHCLPHSHHHRPIYSIRLGCP